ncbi:flavin reductase family protein [Kribbella sp.]|uniref:flavin reductase family protein n=1 Tax=Kribbella sp. TaxID=1871183 RepID=UPI002D3CFE1F|nr:flavin reductase family protein [Kribbella sp.]HZX03853.1 flavin reductase family protein [Kribbella sp.]
MTHLTIEPSILYVGTPVALLSTLNEDGTVNLAPMSSAWALGNVVVLGIGIGGQTATNLQTRPEVAINYPSPDLWQSVERLAPLTAANPVPPHKQARFHHNRDKFTAAALTPTPSDLISPPRVTECPLQFEAAVVQADLDAKGNFLIAQAEVLKVHAAPHLVLPGTSHIDPAAWSPLIYNFRHYYGLGPELGESFRTQTPKTKGA